MVVDAALSEKNKQIVLTAMTLLTGENADKLDELFHPDYRDHNAPPSATQGSKRVLEVAAQVLKTFPDLRYEVEAAIAEDDLVSLRLVMRGTHKGPLMGMGLPATGKEVAVKHLHMIRVVEGRISDHWAVRDDLTMMRQLGVIPDPA
ncbi:ester cyclase [Actinoallomurus acanthiterrae]